MSDAAHEPISRMPDLYALDLETPWTAGRDSLHCLKDAKRKLQPTAEGRIATRFTAEKPLVGRSDARSWPLARRRSALGMKVSRGGS